SMIAHVGLVPALRRLCREFAEHVHIAVEFDGHDLRQDISADVAIALFRIAQEGLANVAKHSGSRDARVRLTELTGELRLSVVDGGIGFDMKHLSSNRGLGLISIRERARVIGADVDIRSVLSKGTTIEVRLALPRA